MIESVFEPCTVQWYTTYSGVLNRRIPTDRTPRTAATSSSASFAQFIAVIFSQTSIWMDFQAHCAAFRLAANDAILNFFYSNYRELRSMQLLWHALFQHTFPKHDSGAVISNLVINGFPFTCFAIFVSFRGLFDSFRESIPFQISLFEVILHLFIGNTRLIIKNANHVALSPVHWWRQTDHQSNKNCNTKLHLRFRLCLRLRLLSLLSSNFSFESSLISKMELILTCSIL